MPRFVLDESAFFCGNKSPIVPRLFCSVILMVKLKHFSRTKDENDDQPAMPGGPITFCWTNGRSRIMREACLVVSGIWISLLLAQDM
jgi:hypothetical protein